jgi:hypothetical protein
VDEPPDAALGAYDPLSRDLKLREPISFRSLPTAENRLALANDLSIDRQEKLSMKISP